MAVNALTKWKRADGTVGVLAGARWGDDSFKVMNHQSTNLLWLCRVGGHGRDHGRGIVMCTCHVNVVHTRIIQAHLVGS